jgi:hypothetical protein
MANFLSDLDASMIALYAALVATYAALVATVVGIIELRRWRREQYSLFALLAVDPPPEVQACWDPETLQLHLFDRSGQGPIPEPEVGITNIGSGVARNIEINFYFELTNLSELIERSGIFRGIAHTVSPDTVVLTAERVGPDTDGDGLMISKYDAKIGYKIDGDESVRILDPTKHDVQKSQIIVKIPRPVRNAMSLFCLASCVKITRERMGSVGEHIQSTYRASVRDVETNDQFDSWRKYKHKMPSLIVGIQCMDDYGRRTKQTFQMDGSFICAPNPIINRRQRRDVVAVYSLAPALRLGHRRGYIAPWIRC